MGWLILVSMFVCVIGITNAMLMSVTERFAQIATMKCLGALDGFIMLMFVLESCFMGVVGGILGALIGATLGVLRMTGVLGTEVLRVPVQQLVIATSAATAVGVLLSAVAAVYPALRAARLAPMEAMRIQ
jgi:putative ABC transport system permease protein